MNFHSAGIGGGGFMNVYTKSEGKAKIYDFREVAPLSSTEKMFVNKSSKVSTTGLFSFNLIHTGFFYRHLSIF